jgi:hypothetical protein
VATPPAPARTRENQAVRGTAVPRGSVPPAPRPPINPRDRWYGWYPWYPYDPYYGYIGYSPWAYSGFWAWHRVGWYDPFWYSPWYPGFGYGVTYWPSDRVDVDEDRGVETGSVRLRVNPEHARVYVDGALVGVAGEFGGLTNHLKLPPGRYQFELRADGYEPATVEVVVESGRVRTTRVKLNRLPGSN